MKIGRNDPCPCNSGKKYKKCCLAKDEAAAREAATRHKEAAQAAATYIPVIAPERLPFLSLPEPPPRPARSLLDEARDDLWMEFEEAEADERVAIFRRALADLTLLDGELAFEMLSSIHDYGDRVNWAELLGELQTQRPDLYQADLHYYLDYQITDALAASNLTLLPQLTTALAATAGDSLDTFYTVLEHLAYHGQTVLIADMLHLAWPHVHASHKYLPGTDTEFIDQALVYTLLAYVERSPEPHTDDPKLMGAMEVFDTIDWEQVRPQLKLLLGNETRSWSLDDFALQKRGRNIPPEKKEPGDLAVRNLLDLSFAFLGDLHAEGVPLAKGNLARKTLLDYILNHREDMSQLSRAQSKKARQKAAVWADLPNMLCPVRATFDPFLAGKLHFLSLKYHTVAATLELVPAWLRSLEARGLLSAEQYSAALEDLRGLAVEALPVWEKNAASQMVAQNIRQAWELG